MRVLIVDDEPMVARTLALIFRRHGYDAEFVSSANAALESVSLNPPDLVLSDINMPGRDGLSLIRELTLVLPDCPILVLTGFYSTVASVRAYAATLKQKVTVLTKPCVPTELLQHAHDLLKVA